MEFWDLVPLWLFFWAKKNCFFTGTYSMSRLKYLAFKWLSTGVLIGPKRPPECTPDSARVRGNEIKLNCIVSSKTSDSNPFSETRPMQNQTVVFASDSSLECAYQFAEQL
ncbi:unnamed protein product [Kuraishia capsulata CBS 1993]|uniref:Uncharacterized protein n=1 Tax=Kuraishia capsulata CBS 1993 TaxID=1382522 RepID=W6MUN3_9ASCO|nr:uncharacterized protein KUCA_T00001750001 [Kuraishia capsulata CBS 1993]CDK25780.1 unnamed protein product [Kuraishia capsulata CBS 1993]